MTHHRLARVHLAIVVAVGFAAHACGRDEGLAKTADTPNEAHGGMGGDDLLGNAGRGTEQSVGAGGGVAGAGASGGDESGGGASGADAGGATNLPEQVAATFPGLKLKRVSVLQAVTVPVMEEMIEIETRKAQVVAGRPGLLRVYVKPAANWRAREVRARLTIQQGPAGLTSATSYEQKLFVSRESTDGEPSSTFNFDLSADAFDVSTSYSVELLGVETDTERAQDPEIEGTRFPVEDSLPLRVVEGRTLRVRIVPIEMHVGGQAFLPDTSSEQLELLRREVVKVFPVRDIELSVGDSALSSAAADMVGVFDQVKALRDEENADPGMTYYGLVRFGADLVSYCSPSCVLGASAIGEVPEGGAAAGIGYTGSKAAITFAHELGHVFGRPHTPCGVAGDPQFPYPGGGIGAWGYDVFAKAFVDPADHRDFMGYCSPPWVSDHTYEHLRQFIEAVPSTPAPAGGDAGGAMGTGPSAQGPATFTARRERRLATPIIRCGEP